MKLLKPRQTVGYVVYSENNYFGTVYKGYESGFLDDDNSFKRYSKNFEEADFYLNRPSWGEPVKVLKIEKPVKGNKVKSIFKVLVDE